MPNEWGNDAMRLRRPIGIFLACLVTFACASVEAFEESTFHDPGDATVTSQENEELPTANPRNLPCGVAQECALRVAGLVRVHVPLPAQWD